MSGTTWSRQSVHDELRRLRHEQQLRSVAWVLAVATSALAILGGWVLVTGG